MTALARLRDVFRHAAAERIALLEDTVARLRNAEPGAVESLRRVAHSLRGTGGTYGFPEVTAAAGAVEDAADDALEPATRVLIDVLRGVVAASPATIRDILVIDDDPLIRQLLEGLLAARDRRVICADSWAGAQTALDRIEPSLILLDLMLGDADGRDVLVALREDPRTATVPIFVLSSGVHGVAPRAECQVLGADEYLNKPFDADALAARVAETLRNMHGRGNWRIDAPTGLLNRAGFREMFERSAARVATLAVIGARDDAALPADVGKAVMNAAADAAIVARWDGKTLAALLTQGTEEDQRATVAEIVADAGDASGAPLVAGMTNVQSGEPVHDAVDRACRDLTATRAGGASDTGSPAPVLLAEDDPLVSRLVSDRLGRVGLSVVTCTSGVDALRLASSGRYSCAILDVKLPELNGFAVLTELRRNPGTARLPVAMLTSMGQEKDVTRGLTLGADDYIVKPFSPRELTARVLRLIERRRDA